MHYVVLGHPPFDALTKANTFDLLAFGSGRAFFDTSPTRNRKAYSGWKWKKNAFCERGRDHDG